MKGSKFDSFLYPQYNKVPNTLYGLNKDLFQQKRKKERKKERKEGRKKGRKEGRKKKN